MKTAKTVTINCGAFDAENFWRDNDLAKLPAFNDTDSGNIVMAMDELMFPFCSSGDTLITRFPMEAAHRTYLLSIGFDFKNNTLPLKPNNQKQEKNKDHSVFELLADFGDNPYFEQIIPPGSLLSPFSVLPYITEMCDKFSLRADIPAYDAVRKVNSKLYSTALRDRLNIKNMAQIISGSMEISKTGEKLLKDGPFLIKDDFGVSGKGNLLISSENILKNIVQHIQKQEQKGKRTLFILEPLLNKAEDFSCQFHIDTDGKVEIISVQKVANTNFAYRGSYTAQESFINTLEKAGYFDLMKKIGKELYTDNYHGDICVDSMTLKNGELVPLVEINARKSMSLIKHHMDKRLSGLSAQGFMTYLSVGSQHVTTFSRILDKMKQEKILFSPTSNNKGIIPMSANTLTINSNDRGRVYKGRLYLYIISREDERNLILEQMRDILSSLSFKIYN